MRGFYNLVLGVNLTQKSFDIKIIPDDVTRKFLGGKGLASYLLLQHNPAGVDPFGKDNHLIFAVGPVTGTGIWGSCRYGVFTKSPQTGLYSESYSGGTVAENMAGTGFDAFMLEGASEEPVWLEIAEDQVIFHPAAALWGIEARETEDRVRRWIEQNRPGGTKCGVAAIGHAGENLAGFAVIENDRRRSTGRTGAGAVMGSKKIKAIAFCGNRRKEVACESSWQGACRLHSNFYRPELSGMVRRDRMEDAVEMLAEWEDRLLIFDTLILCRFYRDLYQWDSLAEIIRCTTGLDLDVESMRKTASEVIDNTRRFNVQEGLTMERDLLPVRFFTGPLPENGRIMAEEEMLKLLKEYYRARGWDEEGFPSDSPAS